jgi:hypothetical protein
VEKHLSRFALLFICLLACTSCFDIHENIFLKKDGSGNFSFSIDLTQMKPMMVMLESDKSAPDKQSTQESLNDKFEVVHAKLSQVNGITNIHSIEDTANYTFGIAFDFSNVTALNKAMNKLFEEDTAKAKQKEIVYFEMKDHQLIRKDELDSKSILGKSGSLMGSKSRKSENITGSLDQLFSTVTYSTTYQFESKITGTLNSNSIISGDKKKVTVTCYPFAALKDSTQKKCSIANTITLKN